MTNKEKVLNVLEDGEWHCAICAFGDFHSQHAATIRDLAEDDGYNFDNQADDAIRTYKYGIRKFCEKCNKNTTHRKLK